MATLEQVEKLRQKVDCSYEEAKAALETCDDDMLEALIYLEKKGKESKGSYNSGSYSTQDGERHTYSEGGRTTTHTTYTTTNDGNFSDSVNSFFSWLGKLIRQGNKNYLDVINHDNVVLSIPLTVLVLLLVFLFWIMLPAFIIGLFCGLKFQFRGKDFQDSKANDYMNDASNAAENAKQKVKEEFADNKGKDDPYDDNNHKENV